MTTYELSLKDESSATRRQFVGTVAGAVTAVPSLHGSNAAEEDKSKLGGINAIPPLAQQWQSLDLAKIVKYPAAFMSVSQLRAFTYRPARKQPNVIGECGSLPATVKVVKAARAAPTLKCLHGSGYEISRDNTLKANSTPPRFQLEKGIENWSRRKRTTSFRPTRGPCSTG